MHLLEELRWRNLIQDFTPGLEEKLAEGPCKIYVGFDPTAPSLTIGNMVMVTMLMRIQRAGHIPVVLMGGATGRIGDPSGKDKERQLKTYEELDNNLAKQQAQFRQFLDFEGEQAALMVNNYDFYRNMNAIAFLRDVGKNVTVNYMMAKESVKRRLEGEGLSFTEFSYQLLQAYDFQYLYEKEDVTVQMGGSDQWGNLMTGVEFIRKNGGKAFALTAPLLTKADGRKFGKSEEGNIWLDANMTSPYQFYQFFINAADADMPTLLRTFSFRSKEEIEALEAEHAQSPHLRLAQQALAEEMCIRVHGQANFEAAKKVSSIVFSKKLKRDFLEGLSDSDFAMLAKELPSFSVARSQVETHTALIDLLTEQNDALGSKSDLRRAIKQKALSLNTLKIESHEQTVGPENLLHDRYLFLQKGKKSKFVVIVE